MIAPRTTRNGPKDVGRLTSFFQRFKTLFAGVVLATIALAVLIAAVIIGSVIAAVVCIVVVVVIAALIVKSMFHQKRPRSESN